MIGDEKPINLENIKGVLASERTKNRNLVDMARKINPQPIKEKPNYAQDNAQNYAEFNDMVDGLKEKFDTKAKDVKLTDNYR